MKVVKFLSLGLLISISYQCKEVKKEVDATQKEVKAVVEEAKPKTLKVTLEPKSDTNVSGEITFSEISGSVHMVATITGLTPGEHAIHIHEKADCSSADGKSTGGHWNPTFSAHGKWGAPEGYHKGDIGNFTEDANGNGKVEFTTDEWCIGCGENSKDITGKGVIVHQGADDFVTQPTGDAGGRVSCAGLIL